jgi:hypothetical protein
MGISRDYPLKTRNSKQSIGEISRYEIIPSHPLKYPRSKQGLNGKRNRVCWLFKICGSMDRGRKQKVPTELHSQKKERNGAEG